jgi:signal transduction histidine kinase
VSENADPRAPRLRRLKWLTVLAPLVFLALVDLARHLLYPSLLDAWPGYILLGGIVLTGALFFSEAIFGIVGSMQGRLQDQNRELLALHEAGLAIAGDLSLETVLQRVVETARDLVGARYGALSILGDDGSIQLFLTSGISAEERARIGATPVGRGLLGVVLHEGQRLRISDIGRDGRSVGFPPDHPPMRSLLAVPVFAGAAVVGNLYLTEKVRAPEFSAADEETLGRFATWAGLAIQNARLHQQVHALAVAEERDRMAREMHDSLAQVLGYVNTKAQAAEQLLQAGRPEPAGQQIRQLAEAAREAYADVRENILALRTSLGADRNVVDALRAYVEHWRDQSGVPAEFEVTPAGGATEPLTPIAELQLLRIVQEALTNVRKHAQATRVRVELRYAAGRVEAMVEDDGTGFHESALSPGAYPRFGLATMRERAEAVGGTLRIDSAPGRGTRVVAELPTQATTLNAGESDARAHR